jgi:hypothetical protein
VHRVSRARWWVGGGDLCGGDDGVREEEGGGAAPAAQVTKRRLGRSVEVTVGPPLDARRGSGDCRGSTTRWWAGGGDRLHVSSKSGSRVPSAALRLLQVHPRRPPAHLLQVKSLP